MPKVRALRNELRLGIGNWQKDFRKGDVYDVPDNVAEILIDTDVAVAVPDEAVDNPHFDSTKETDAQLADRVRKAIAATGQATDPLETDVTVPKAT